MGLTFALLAAAASIGSTHTMAPDHWAPFAALARAERWSAGRTAAMTSLCGFGHVTASVALGLLAAFAGLELFETFGRRLEAAAGFFLIGFGLVYALWGVHVGVRRRWHDHGTGNPHWHVAPLGHHCHMDVREGRLTAWTLFLLFSADPCVAVIPLLFAAMPLGWPSALAVVVSYELATIGTMVALVLPARAAVNVLRDAWADRYGRALAGGVLAAVGLVVVGWGL